ncbi:MAG: hypothetical protein ABIR24_08075, partial [Verrucomicrobiota bacterium]
MTSSCANHVIQLKFLVMSFVETEEFFPSEKDTRKALSKMSPPNNQWPTNWLFSSGSSCPESFDSRHSIGYIFVADGLPTKTALECSALVFFCPAESHQGSEQHCHAMFADGLRCLASNTAMIEVLQFELSRAESGTLRYSTNAQALFEAELAAREKYARKRGTNIGSRIRYSFKSSK